MSVKDISSLKPLTEGQMKKCDKITSLLLELKRSGVHPIVIDGGGGNGLQFVRCSQSEMWDVGEILLDGDREEIQELNALIYGHDKYWEYKVDCIVP